MQTGEGKAEEEFSSENHCNTKMATHMKRWSIAETRDLVEARFGRAHRDQVTPSLNSLADRLSHAQYHYEEIERLLNHFSELHLCTKPLIAVIYDEDESGRVDFELLMIAVAAHATACVLSLHAISDIAANATYHALGYSLRENAMPERDISAASVQRSFKDVPGHAPIAEVFSRMQSDPSYNIISALANKSKHQSIVKPLLNEDWTGSRPQRHEFRFSAFKYAGREIPEKTFNSVLEPAFELSNRTVIEIGNFLNEILADRTR